MRGFRALDHVGYVVFIMTTEIKIQDAFQLKPEPFLRTVNTLK